MFTGLVEEKGTLKEKIATGDGFQFVIEANKIIFFISLSFWMNSYLASKMGPSVFTSVL